MPLTDNNTKTSIGEHYFVGDLQGCYDPLRRLLDKVSFNPDIDKLYLTGDLIARGPKSLQTLRFVKSLGNSANTVLGNHDLHLLATHYGIKVAKKSDRLETLLAAPDVAELAQWLRQQPLLLSVNEKVILTHAGISPQWGIKKAKRLAIEAEDILKGERCYEYLVNMYQDTPDRWSNELLGYERFRFIVNSFTRMRFCYPDKRLEFKTKCAPTQLQKSPLVPWFKRKRKSWSKHTLVFGHWASLMGKTGASNIIALDTGCVWGNRMTLWRLSDSKYISVAGSR